ncbi:MAG TPA: anthrone oxygenase family protein [Chitinophagaceae bacterium]
MKLLFLFASTALASGLLFANIYTSWVDARSWGADIPRSIETAREYFKTVNPGNFFRMVSPANQVVALLVLILFWKVSATVRIYLGMALAIYVCVDLFTFAYFYPRNSIMFEKGSLTDIDTLKNAWTGWNTINWLRSFVIFAGLVFSFLALHKIYTAK